MKKCLYCEEECMELVDKHFCSEECSKKWDIRSDLQTCTYDKVVCPYCRKVQSDITNGGYYEADNEVFICDRCDRDFYLTAETRERFKATESYITTKIRTQFTATPTEEVIEDIYSWIEEEEREKYIECEVTLKFNIDDNVPQYWDEEEIKEHIQKTLDDYISLNDYRSIDVELKYTDEE